MIAALRELPPLAILLGAALVARRAGLPGEALLVGAGLCLGLSLVRALVGRGLARDGYTGREPRSLGFEGLLTGTAWLCAAVFALLALAPLLDSPRLPAWVALAGTLLLGARTLAQAVPRAVPPPRGDERHWVLGALYANRRDPAVVVPQRLGPGYTLNLARPRAWLLLLAVLALPALAARWLAQAL